MHLKHENKILLFIPAYSLLGIACVMIERLVKLRLIKVNVKRVPKRPKGIPVLGVTVIFLGPMVSGLIAEHWKK